MQQHEYSNDTHNLNQYSNHGQSMGRQGNNTKRSLGKHANFLNATTEPSRGFDLLQLATSALSLFPLWINTFKEQKRPPELMKNTQNLVSLSTRLITKLVNPVGCIW